MHYGSCACLYLTAVQKLICTKPDTAKSILQPTASISPDTLRTILKMNAVGLSLSADLINEIRNAIECAGGEWNAAVEAAAQKVETLYLNPASIEDPQKTCAAAIRSLSQSRCQV
jgi:hypothetical protein